MGNHTLNLQSNNFTKPINTKSIIMDSVKQAGNFVSDKVQQAAHRTSKEANKEVAKDSNAPIGTRASAAKDAVGDKAKESKHDAKGDAHKEAIYWSRLDISFHDYTME